MNTTLYSFFFHFLFFLQLPLLHHRAERGHCRGTSAEGKKEGGREEEEGNQERGWRVRRMKRRMKKRGKGNQESGKGSITVS
jgi:hypothetical protein